MQVYLAGPLFSQAERAWLDGPIVDDGTAAEIGAFAELVASGDPRYRGIVGLVTDLRLERRRGRVPGDGMNLFVAGAVASPGLRPRAVLGGPDGPGRPSPGRPAALAEADGGGVARTPCTPRNTMDVWCSAPR